MLDLIGDLTLIGRPLFKMRIEAERLGHAHNVEFAKLLNEAAKKLRKSKTRVLEAK
jgi:UDP-3-O-acyl-N-acetylglucosamine deacetylase